MRFLDVGVVTPEESIRLEKKAFDNCSDNTLLIYTRDRPTVSLGGFNEENKAINISFAEENNITIVRRLSGGSAIYCDSDQLTFSFTAKKEDFPFKEDSFEVICNCMVKTLGELGIQAVYKPRNDVLVDNMKISGCAEYRDKDVVLHHGSLILKLDSKMMDSVLKPVKTRKYRKMTSVEECLGYVPDRATICDSFKKGFSSVGEAVECGKEFREFLLN